METNSITNAKTIGEIIAETSAVKGKRNTGELSKDDFLNLLVTQLQYQDPLKPMEDKEFISQMAQFSSLEQMQNMSRAFTDTKAFAMIGKEITANLLEDGSFAYKTITGVVSSVKLNGSGTVVVVDGRDIPVDKVSDVREYEITREESSLMNYANLIGLKTIGEINDTKIGETMLIAGTVGSIAKENGSIMAYIDDVAINASTFGDTDAFVSMEELELYLQNNIDTKITVKTYNSNGVEVSVEGLLREYTIDENLVVLVIIDEVPVSVNNLTGLSNQ